MRVHVVMKYIGLVLLLNALLMYFCVGVSLLNGTDGGFVPLLTGAVIATIVGIFPNIFIREEYDISKKESYAIVVSAAFASCIIGAVPFILSGNEFTLANAWFESVSGYTTTGSSILSNVEALPKSMLMWRSCTHFLGGAGIIIFALALMPMISKSRASLSSVELSPFVKDNFKFRVQRAVRILLYVYLFLILLETVLLHIAGMTWFDALNHAFSTVATGGFSTKNLSIAYFDSVWIELIIIVFMVLSGMHFGLLFSTITTRKNNIFRSEVTRFYLLTILVCSLVVAVNLWSSEVYGFLDSLRHSFFVVSTLITTTGFALTDTAFWPSLSVIVMIYVLFNGGCAGSTAGGIQSDRMLLVYKALKTQFLRLQHPNAVVKVRLGKINTDDNLVTSTLLYALFFVLVVLIGTVVTTAMGVDVMTAFSANLASISNAGPGFGAVSSLSNYSSLPDAVKVLLTFVMLAGRLQLFSFFQLFLLSSWK